MRYRVLHDRRAEAARRWVVIDDLYGLVMGYFASEEAAARAAERLAR